MNTRKKALRLSIFILFLSACSSFAPSPTETPTLLPTSTNTPEPTFTPAFTATFTATNTLEPSPTFTPSITEIPRPASLTGTIMITRGTNSPFPSEIQLRQGKEFQLIAKTTDNSAGVYTITNIQPGVYDLWILITRNSVMLPNCTDVAPPDMSWKLGMVFTEGQALTMENAYLSKGLMLSDALKDSGMNASAFYFVLTDFEIKSGIENKQDLIMSCQ